MNFPPDVEILNESKIFLWRPHGVLNERKTDKIVAFVTEQESKFGRCFDRFSDLSALDAVDLTFKYVFQVALYRRVARLGREPIKSAFFVTSPAVGRYIKVHALITDHSPLKVAMFEEREAAAQWLGLSPALLEPK